MASHQKERTRPEIEKSVDASQEQSLTRYATVIGIVTGLFGMLLGVGLILLPSTTTQEKVLVIVACLAVSTAGLTGVGAWRSRRKFALTAAAVGLAIVCLSDLSVAAAENAPAAASQPARSQTISAPGASSGDHAPSSPTPSPTGRRSTAPTDSASPGATASSRLSGTSSASPTFSRPLTSAPGPPAVFLSNLMWSPDQVGEAAERGAWTINAKTYGQSIGYAPTYTCTSPNMITFDLGSNSYRHFLAEVGVADGYAPADESTEVGFSIFGETSTGASYNIYSITVQAENPASLDLLIRPGTEEIQLRTTLSGCLETAMVWGTPG